MQLLGLDGKFVALGLDLSLGPLRWGVALLDLLCSFLLVVDHHALVVGGDGRVHVVGVLEGSVAGRGAVVAVRLEGLKALWRRLAQGPWQYLQTLH